jgi:high affinity sulfate transporter 1
LLSFGHQVKFIEKGINPSSAHKIFFTGPFVLKGFKIGVVCGIVGLTVCMLI